MEGEEEEEKEEKREFDEQGAAPAAARAVTVTLLPLSLPCARRSPGTTVLATRGV